MKQRSTREVRQSKDLQHHVQELTDDVSAIINAGLDYDKNMPSRIFTVNVTSGVSFSLPVKANFGTYGAAIIFVGDNATVSSTGYTANPDKSMNMTITFSDAGSHSVTLFVIYRGTQ